MRRALADYLRLLVSSAFFVRIGAILLAGTLAGLTLLVAADSLVSMPAIGARLLEAAERGELGDQEGMTRVFGFEASRFSECIGLSVATSGLAGEPAFSIRSRAVLWQPGTNICDTAARAVKSPKAVAWFDYSRYWHGYRVLVFPLVEWFGLEAAGLMLGALAIISCAAFFVVMMPLAGPGALAAFLAAMALMGLPLVVLTPTHAVSLATLFAGATVFALVAPPYGRQGRVILAFALGCAFNYFDFFYNPGAFAMLLGGALILAAVRNAGDLRIAALDATAVAIACLIGYLAFWAAKWLLAIPYSYTAEGEDPVRAGDFLRWVAGGDGAYSPLAATWHLAGTTFNEPAKLAFAAVALTTLLAANARAGWRLAAGLAAMTAPVLVGLAAVEAAAGHSVAHAPFTFRIVPLALALALLTAGAALRPIAGPVRPPPQQAGGAVMPAASERSPRARLRAGI